MWKIETDRWPQGDLLKGKKYNYVNVSLTSAAPEGAPLKSPGATAAQMGGDGQTGGQTGGGIVGQAERWVERDR